MPRRFGSFFQPELIVAELGRGLLTPHRFHQRVRGGRIARRCTPGWSGTLSVLKVSGSAGGMSTLMSLRLPWTCPPPSSDGIADFLSFGRRRQ